VIRVSRCYLALLPELKYSLDAGPKSSGKLQRQNRRWYKDSVLDSVDRLSRNADQCSKLGLSQIPPSSLLSQAIDELAMHRDARAARGKRTTVTQS
jgi:hypothetical protein